MISVILHAYLSENQNPLQFIILRVSEDVGLCAGALLYMSVLVIIHAHTSLHVDLCALCVYLWHTRQNSSKEIVINRCLPAGCVY